MSRAVRGGGAGRAAVTAALLLALLVVSSVQRNAEAQGSTAEREREVLLLWKQSVEHTPASVMANWSELTDHCSGDWMGIGCSDGRVYSLNLGNSLQGNNNHKGPLIKELSVLDALHRFGMRENLMLGTLPEEWSVMTSLTEIRGTFNDITGTLPPEWAAMSNLQIVELGSLRLNGTLPAAWSTLTRLTYLDLSGNDLSSSLPPEFSGLHNLRLLDLSVNHIHGTLPREWSSLEELQTLNIGTNVLKGAIPMEWQNMNQLHELLMPGNELSGSLPEWIMPPGLLSSIEIHHNSIQGSLPKSWSKLASLSYLVASFNRLEGSLPREWSAMQKLTTLILENNFLTGALPHEWSSCWQLKRIMLTFNSLSGHLPATWRIWEKVEEISLGQNLLTSQLPAEWSSMETLTRLSLAENFLSGSLPSGWSSWGRMAELHLSGDFISGPLPPSWSAMEELSELSVGDNLLTGHLPPEWSTFVGLRVFAAPNNFLRGQLPFQYSVMRSLLSIDMGNNRITGTLPKQWSSMNLLQVFNMEYNALTGSIPAEMGAIEGLITVHLEQNYLRGKLGLVSHKRISSLHLHENYFSGTLPASWSSLRAIVDLSIHSNRMTGTIHPQWSTMTTLQSLYLSNNDLTGTLPDSLSALTNLEYLDASHNMLRGTLPKVWSVLQSLGNLMLGSNTLHGTLPSEYSAWGENANIVESLRFDDNNFTGSLPLSWSTLEPRFLHVADNGLDCPEDGVLPGSLSWAIENSVERNDGDMLDWRDVLCPEDPASKRLPQVAVISLSVIGGAVLSLATLVVALMLYHRLTCRNPTCAHRHPGLKHALAGHFFPGLSDSSCSWCSCNTGKPDMDVLFKREVKPLLKSSAIIGIGGYGQVYRAIWRGHDVAIKVILNGVDDVAINSFTAEVQASNRFTGNPKFVRLLGACMRKPDLCLISEFVPGGTLQSVIDENPSGLPISKVLKYGMDLAEALSYMHPEYVHRDLKPENVLLCPREDSMKLIDFGMGRLVVNPLIDKTMTQGAGTPAYMAPEQFEGHITPKTDIYALGIILCQCLSGKAPFERLNNQQIMYAVLMKEQRPDIPEDCPELLRLLLVRCWEENPKLRPAADEVRHMLGFLYASLDCDGIDNEGTCLGSNGCSSPHIAQELGLMLSVSGRERGDDSRETSAMPDIEELSKESHDTLVSGTASKRLRSGSRAVGDDCGLGLMDVGSRGGEIGMVGQLGGILSRDRLCRGRGEGGEMGLLAVDSRASVAEGVSLAQQLSAMLSRERVERERGVDWDQHYYNHHHQHAWHTGLAAMASVAEERSLRGHAPSILSADGDDGEERVHADVDHV